jgi:hypothetical protein
MAKNWELVTLAFLTRSTCSKVNFGQLQLGRSFMIPEISDYIHERKGELNLQYIGLALKRYPELEHLFHRLEIDLARAKHAARHLDPSRLPAPAPGDVQEGLLG